MARRRRKRPRPESVTYDVRIDLRQGTWTYQPIPAANLKCHLRYIACHELIPVGIEAWTDQQLRALVDAAKVAGDEAAWERALVLLAHHPSQLARDLLNGVERLVPEAMRAFWEMALAESFIAQELGWSLDTLSN